MRNSLSLILLLGLVACQYSQDSEKVFEQVSGSYIGELYFEDQALSIDLQLMPNGFYRIEHGIIGDTIGLRVEDRGVYWVNADQKIDLARNFPGFRYFKWTDKGLLVLNSLDKPYRFSADSLYYLPIRTPSIDSLSFSDSLSF